MTAAMTSRERLLTAIRHQEPDRVPISPRYYDYLNGVEGCSCWMHYLDFARKVGIDPLITLPPQVNNYLLQHAGPYDDLEGVDVKVEITREPQGTLVRRTFKTPAGELSDLRQIPADRSIVGFDHLIETLVKERADLAKIPFLLPRPETVYLGDIALVTEIVGEQGLVEYRPTQGTDQYLVDAVGVIGSLLLYYDDRDMLRELVRIFNAHTHDIMRLALEAGATVIFDAWYNCSISTGWSPDQWKEVFLPHIRQNVELVHSYGAIYHFYDDGKMNSTLEYLAEAGVDLVETLSPPPLGDVDLASAKGRVGDRVCLKGHVDQVNVILPGTPSQIREVVRQAIEVGAPGGGFILGTADSIRPETPKENVKAYFDAAKEFAAKAYV